MHVPELGCSLWCKFPTFKRFFGSPALRKRHLHLHRWSSDQASQKLSDWFFTKHCVSSQKRKRKKEKIVLPISAFEHEVVLAVSPDLLCSPVAACNYIYGFFFWSAKSAGRKGCGLRFDWDKVLKVIKFPFSFLWNYALWCQRLGCVSTYTAEQGHSETGDVTLLTCWFITSNEIPF